jgi:protein O-GlcNAc transferase
MTSSGQTVSLIVEQALQQAVAHHQAGHWQQAENIYRQILQHHPDHADALYLLGTVCHQTGNNEMAVDLISRAIRMDAANPFFHDNLGTAFQAMGRLEEAITCYRQAILLDPDFAGAHFNLGNVLQRQGQAEQAAGCYRKALALDPGYVDAYVSLGNTLQALGRPNEAVACYQKALALNPNYAEVYFNLGILLQELGRPDEAFACHRRVVELRPDFAEAHNNLGNVLTALRQLDDAVACYRRALELKGEFAEAHYNLGNVLTDLGQPVDAVASHRRALELKADFAEAHSSLGNALTDIGQLDDAVACYRRALELKPDFAEAHNNLGHALTELGQADDALASYRSALELKPDFTWAYDNLLFALNYHPDLSAEDIFRAYQEYDAASGIPLRSSWRAHGNDKNPHRRLRVGYVSPDFYRHSVRHFLEPLLAAHDKNQVEVYAYAELDREDDMTDRYRRYADHWIASKGMSDDVLAERIRSDGIDILVELAGHTVGNRLLAFARKPAPVSVSWLGYGYTTGLSAIDYYLTDAACAPAGSEGLFAEQPWRVATPAYVYRPAADMGGVGSLPALRRGHVTFGTLTRSVRINHRTIRVWSEILKAVPNSRLVIDSASFKHPAMQERMAARFAEHGIARQRLFIGLHSPPWNLLRGMDIGLDCFPHNSGATLFETLYMGVPVITLAGRPSMGRLGSSILHGAGHPEWIAESEDEYVAKVVELAGDIARLSEIRAALRGQMQASPLMDEAGFARKVEQAYRGMWQNWCTSGRDNRV